MSATEATVEELNLNEDETTEEEEMEESEDWSPAGLFLEDFVVTALLSAGRQLRSGELAARAEGFSPSRHGLKETVGHSSRVISVGRDWDCSWRNARKGLSREERSRQPIESMIRELLQAVGKPLPVAVIAREIGLIRNLPDPGLKDTVSNVLRTSRFATEIVPNIWLHDQFVLTVGAPSEETLIRANSLDKDPDFQGLIEFAEITATTPAEIAEELMEFTGGPLKQKVIGFFVWRANPAKFSAKDVSAALNDRSKFQPLIDGFVALQAQVEDLRASVQELLDETGGSNTNQIDVHTLLRTRVAANEAITPSEAEVEEVRKLAKAGDGTPVSLATVVLDLFEMDPEDPRLVPVLQGLNNALRSHPAFMPVGIGRFILRESIPPYINDVPEELRPVILTKVNAETKEPIDFEMTDEGLEGDTADFVHAPEWEDVGEEGEARQPRRPVAQEVVKLPVLNHHLRAGTIKLRHQDLEFFDLTGTARLAVRDKKTDKALTAWASRETGLIQGMGPWITENLPYSGGVLLFEHDGHAGFFVSVDGSDEATFISPERAEILNQLREQSEELSLYELLQKILGAHQEGLELAKLWAEVNAVRRTSKRVMCSVLCGYHSFFFRQRGPKLLSWKFDAARTDQAFKKNKKKFVRE